MYRKIKTALAAASRVILAAPVKLPGRVVQIAQYVALAIGLLDAVDRQREPPLDDSEEGGMDER